MEMGSTYALETYMAMIWPEHYKYQAMGYVNAAYSDTKTDKTGRKVRLMAQIAPSSDLLYNLERGQIIHPSVEVNKNFAQTGKAYLAGLGVTNTPASIGTEPLMFSTSGNIEIFTLQDCLPADLHFREFEDSTTYFDVGAWFSRKPADPKPETLSTTEESFFMTQQDRDEFKTLLGDALKQYAADQEKAIDDKLKAALDEKFKTVDDLKGAVEQFSTELKAFGEQEVVNHGTRPEVTGAQDPDALPEDFC